jgi:hypothetical protein
MEIKSVREMNIQTATIYVRTGNVHVGNNMAWAQKGYPDR